MRISYWSSDVCSSDLFAGQHRADAVQPRAPFFGDLGGGEGTTVVLWHCSLVSARMGHGGSPARLGGGLVKRPASKSTIAEAFRRPGTDRPNGRASCGAKVCRDLELPVVAVSVT